MKSRKKTRKPKRGGKPPEDPVILLLTLARLLNSCEKCGIKPKLKHGIVYTDAGYVLPAKDGKWAARPLKLPGK